MSKLKNKSNNKNKKKTKKKQSSLGSALVENLSQRLIDFFPLLSFVHFFFCKHLLFSCSRVPLRSFSTTGRQHWAAPAKRKPFRDKDPSKPCCSQLDEISNSIGEVDPGAFRCLSVKLKSNGKKHNGNNNDDNSKMAFLLLGQQWIGVSPYSDSFIQPSELRQRMSDCLVTLSKWMILKAIASPTSKCNCLHCWKPVLFHFQYHTLNAFSLYLPHQMYMHPLIWIESKIKLKLIFNSHSLDDSLIHY